MSFNSTQRVIHRIGHVENWLKATSLENRRIRLMDASDQVIGRVATVISRSLQGKDRLDFVPQSDGGDVVVVLNADKAVLTGSKMQNKIYYRHMGKPGNLRKSTPEEKKEMFGGAELVWQAVNGMLPKNKLRKRRLSRLLIYNDDQHDFDEEYMFPLDPPERVLRPNKLRWNLPEGFTPLNIHAYYSLWKGSDEEWERKAKEIAAAQDKEAEEVLASGWEPPVNVEEQESTHTRRLKQGMRVQ